MSKAQELATSLDDLGAAIPYCTEAATLLRTQDALLRQALDALRVARESVSEWSSYASDYFKDKYDLDGDFEVIDASIEVIEAVLAEQGCDYCNHPQYAGTKCKNCGREQPAQDQGQSCYCPECERLSKELAALRAQQQEPVGEVLDERGAVDWISFVPPAGTPLYTSPQPASKPLTDAQIGAVAAEIWGSVLIAPQSYQAFARAIEAAHGITGEQK